jgi:hypothetical protein
MGAAAPTLATNGPTGPWASGEWSSSPRRSDVSEASSAIGDGIELIGLEAGNGTLAEGQ